jgi:hypothetical protein
MRIKIVVLVLLAFIIMAINFSCAAGSRHTDHPFFKLNDERIQLIQNQVKQVINEKNLLRSHLHPILGNIQYLILGLVALFASLITLFQGLQEKATQKKRIRNIIMVLGIISAALSATCIYLEKSITAQKEISSAVSAYEATINTLFGHIEHAMLRSGDFRNPEDFNLLLKSYDEFNQQIIGINVTFKDNELIQSIGR